MAVSADLLGTTGLLLVQHVAEPVPDQPAYLLTNDYPTDFAPLFGLAVGESAGVFQSWISKNMTW